MRLTRRHFFLLLRILCGVALLWWAWDQAHQPGMEALSEIDLNWRWMPVGVVLGGVALLLWAVRYQLFLRLCGLGLPFTETLRITLFADFFNLYFLGPLGADGLRLLMLSQRFPEKKARVLASIILDHASGLLGGIVLYVIFTRPQSEWIISHGRLLPESSLLIADLALGGMAFATVAALVVLVEPSCWRLAIKAGLGWSLKPLEVFLFLARQRGSVLLAQGVSVLILLCIYLTYWTGGMMAQQQPEVGKILAVMPLVDLVCGLPVTISGLGVRESVFVGLLGPDMPQGNQGALATSLLGFALTGVWGLIGGVWLAFYRRKEAAPKGESLGTPPSRAASDAEVPISRDVA